MKIYFKVQKDICSKCGKEREIVMRGHIEKEGWKKIEVPDDIIGFRCSNCGDFIRADASKRGLTRQKSFIIIN